MTSTVSEHPAASIRPKRRKLTRRAVVVVTAMVAAMFAGLAYGWNFVECDLDSDFCAIGIAGTRSEVVVAWLDGFQVYGQTYNGE